MAEAAAPSKRPNKTLSIVLLAVQCIGAAAFLILAFWLFFQDKRGDAMKDLAYGSMWFLFFGWRARAAIRPFPAE